MDQKADMLPEERRKRRGCLPFIAGCASFFVFFYVLSIISVDDQCVVMPNGFLIGPATVFSPMRGPGADIAIKYPDGRLFLRGDKGMHFWDQDSFGGHYERTPEGRSDSYVYLNDLGLILKSEQPVLYQFHYDRKEVLHVDSAPMVGGHVFRTYSLLHADPANRRKECPTDLAWPRKEGYVPLISYQPPPKS